MKSIFEHDPLDLLTRKDPVPPEIVKGHHGLASIEQAIGALRILGYDAIYTPPVRRPTVTITPFPHDDMVGEF